MTDNILIIHTADNVGVAVKAIDSGESVVAGGKELFSALEAIPASHKVAIRDIEKDDAIIKYGEPVAVSTRKILKGQWVHTHNLESKMWKK